MGQDPKPPETDAGVDGGSEGRQPEERLVCAHCGTRFESRNALFRHLGTESRQGAREKKKVANVALQVGYYWKEACEESVLEGAVDEALAGCCEGLEVLWRCGRPTIPARSAVGTVDGCGAWCDVVNAYDASDRGDAWLARVNARLAARDGPLQLRVLRAVRPKKTKSGLSSDSVAWSRFEVAVPVEVAFKEGCPDPENDDQARSLGQLRKTADSILKGGRKSWHAFGDRPRRGRPPCPGDRICLAAVRRVHCALDQDAVRVAITFEGLPLQRAATRAVALVVAVFNEWLSVEAAAQAFSERTLWFASAPEPPAHIECLASMSFGNQEAKAQVTVDALRSPSSDASSVSKVEAFRGECRDAVRARRLEAAPFWRDFEAWCRSHSTGGLRAPTPRRCRIHRDESNHATATKDSPSYSPLVVADDDQFQFDDHLPEGVRSAFESALSALRALKRDGWPETTPARAARIASRLGPTLGGSFSVGRTPDSQATPRCNALARLVDAVFGLERAVLTAGTYASCLASDRPPRQPSAMCAVNADAAFLPHVDAGSDGDGQSPSLIVCLGEYEGGDLIVEGITHDCRYKPLEFDGWRQRHWTADFTGERFSLVWFTPRQAAAALVSGDGPDPTT